MENNEVDFNIQNYDLDDLEYFFKLDEIPNYTSNDIIKNADEVQNQLLNGGTFDPSLKTGFMKFIQQGKDLLLNSKKPSDSTIYNKKITPNGPSRPVEETPKTSYIYADPSSFYEGTMNPLNTRVVTRILNIDSRFRDELDTNSGDFLINLPMKFYKVVSMQVSTVEIPYSFYGISKSFGNNFFTLEVNDGGAITRNQFVIPDGNYESSQFIDAVNVALGSNAPDPTDPFSCVQFSYDPITRRTTVTGLTSILPTLQSFSLFFDLNSNGDPDNTSLTSKIGYNLGFVKKSYSGELTYTSESVVDPQSIEYMFISVDDFQNNVSNNAFVSAFQDSFLDNNILARISPKSLYKETVVTDETLLSEPRQYFGPVDIQKMRIRLVDEYGRVIDMNKANYSFCLTMKQMYQF